MIRWLVGRDHGRYVAAMERAARWVGDPAVFGARDDRVSGWSVGQHLEHLFRSNRGIVDWLDRVAAGEEVDRRRDRDGPTLMGWIVVLIGYIPRGRGRAPGITEPESMEREAVDAGTRRVLADARRLGDRLESLRVSELRMSHRVFGALSPAQWIRFGRIHHEHHEKIVHDILGGG